LFDSRILRRGREVALLQKWWRSSNFLRQYGFVAVLSGRLPNGYKFKVQVNVYSYVSFPHCDLSHISDVIISDMYFVA